MVQNYSDLLLNEIKSCLMFLIAMLATSSIAFVKGFYKLESDEKIPIKISYFLFVFFVYLFISLIVGPAIVRVLMKFVSKATMVTHSVLINLFLNGLILLLLSIYCFNKDPIVTKQIFKKKIQTSKPISKDIFIGIFSWLIAFPIVSFVDSILDLVILMIYKIHKLPDQIAIEFLRSTISHPFYFGLAIFMIIVIAPILEEFLFRGVLQNFLKIYLKRNLAIILSSMIFALFHFSFFQKLANIPILTSLFVLACFLGFLYEKQQSLISPIFLHSTFNAISVINLIFIKGIHG